MQSEGGEWGCIHIHQKQGVTRSNLGKGRTTLQRENRRREAMTKEEEEGGGWGGVYNAAVG